MSVAAKSFDKNSSPASAVAPERVTNCRHKSKTAKYSNLFHCQQQLGPSLSLSLSHSPHEPGTNCQTVTRLVAHLSAGCNGYSGVFVNISLR